VRSSAQSDLLDGERWDVVVVGGGHNALTAAAYLGRAGRRVLVLERAGRVGGAAVSETPFPGVAARLSRYSYLVSLLPRQIVDELGLDVRLARRRVSSYTPDPAGPGRGLLVADDPEVTRRSFARVGAAADHPGWAALYAGTARLAAAVFPTLTRPLPTRAELRERVGDDAVWTAFVERPLGTTITRSLRSDLVRGVAATDGLIGTLTGLDDPSLRANRCFLYHVIGNGTGRWDVPVGGMGTVTDALERAARRAGARIVTGAEVTAVDPAGRVAYTQGGEERTVHGARVLAGVAPWTLERLCPGACPGPRPQGAQVKVNLLLRRLPALHDPGVPPSAAFAGTLHVNEAYAQLDLAHAAARGGRVPEPLPCEAVIDPATTRPPRTPCGAAAPRRINHCHSLTDPTILSPELAASGAHTLTVFGLQVPGAVRPEQADAWRRRLERAVLASLRSVLAEPVDDLLLTDAAGRPCIETRTTLDLEQTLGMPGGHIFHGDLAWPFLDDGAPRDTPARRWGVATGHPRVLLCGAGAVRGGGVSGIGGHNAAMAVLAGA
jgi:phytoene dehydrogenase-like protein